MSKKSSSYVVVYKYSYILNLTYERYNIFLGKTKLFKYFFRDRDL